MNFLLSEQQLEIQDTVARFLGKALPSPKLHEIADGDSGHEASLWAGFAEIGGAALLVPEVQGGLGLDLLDAALVAETLGQHAAPLPYLGHCLAVLALRLAGSIEQQAQWLPRLADGSSIGTVAWLDEGGWQADQWRLSGNTALTGRKLQVLAAQQSEIIIVGTAGGGLSLVRREAAGLSISRQNGIDRTRRFDRLDFDQTPAEPLPGASPEVAGRLIDAGLNLLAADAFGGASRCLQMAVDYTQTRQQFGVAIGQFQAVKHHLANMAVEIEPARGLFWYAAHAWDQAPEEAPRFASLAKAHLGDRYLQAARDAVEAHGGVGYTWEYDLHLFLKRAMFNSTYLGSSRQHRQRAADLAGW